MFFSDRCEETGVYGSVEFGDNHGIRRAHEVHMILNSPNTNDMNSKAYAFSFMAFLPLSVLHEPDNAIQHVNEYALASFFVCTLVIWGVCLATCAL